MRRLLRDPLLRGWLMLIGLSLGSTGVAIWPLAGGLRVASGAVVLLLALIKTRIILSRYLGLAAAPFWRRGFNAVLGIYVLLLLGLYLVPWLSR